MLVFLGKAKDGSDSRFDRGTWKVMQVTMNDTSKFVDMLHNVPWEDGLPSDVVQGKGSFTLDERESDFFSLIFVAAQCEH